MRRHLAGTCAGEPVCWLPWALLLIVTGSAWPEVPSESPSLSPNRGLPSLPQQTTDSQGAFPGVRAARMGLGIPPSKWQTHNPPYQVLRPSRRQQQGSRKESVLLGESGWRASVIEPRFCPTLHMGPTWLLPPHCFSHVGTLFFPGWLNWGRLPPPEGFPGVSVVKNLPANAGDTGFIPGSGRCPGELNVNSFQYSCLEIPLDREVCWATVHRVAKSQPWVSDWARTPVLWGPVSQISGLGM